MKKKVSINDDEVVTRGILRVELQRELQDFEEKIDSKAQKYRDEVLTKMDEVMGKLETLYEENTIGTYQTRELREQVEDHEKRITKLEDRKN